MRRLLVLLCLATLSLPMSAQTRGRAGRPFRADSAEAAIKQAVDQLAAEKKIIERDIEVLRHLRVADTALVDPMQPASAVQKAYEEVDKAKGLGPDFVVLQGLIRVRLPLRGDSQGRLGLEGRREEAGIAVPDTDSPLRSRRPRECSGS